MKTVKLKTNLIFGIVAIIISAVIWFIIPSQIPLLSITTEHINGRFMPKAMCILMFICGVMCIIRSLVFKDDDEKVIEVNIEMKNIIYLGIVLLYALMARYVSFILASILYAGASLFYMRCRNWKKYLIVFIFVIAVSLIFKYGLRVRFGGLWGI